MTPEQTFILWGEREREHALRSIYEMRIDPKHPPEINIGPHKKKRSLSQNALMWKWINEVVDIVCADTGNDADQIHYWFKEKFLSPTIIEVRGQAVEYRTTTNLTAEEMSAYMDRIHAFVTQELDIRLTLPEERYAA